MSKLTMMAMVAAALYISIAPGLVTGSNAQNQAYYDRALERIHREEKLAAR